MATCHHLGIDTFAYLHEVLARLPTQPAEPKDSLGRQSRIQRPCAWPTYIGQRI
jgi:hypothetical protein